MYNAEKTIGKTLASVLTQTYTDLGLIVVDNCSTDNSVEVVRSFNDSRIRIIQYNIHVPYAELNWNRCFHHATGEYLAIYHADDIYLPDMIEHQLKMFRDNVVGVFTSGNIINDNDDIIGSFKFPEEITGNHQYSYSELLNAFLKHADFLPTPSAMLKRDIYLKCSPFRYDQFRSASDLDLWLRAAAFGDLVILDEKLFNYRVSKHQGSNKINRLRTKESDYFKVMDSHINQNISPETKMNYELSRFGDQVLCQKNFLQQYLIYLLLHPGLLYDKYKMYRYFKVFRK